MLIQEVKNQEKWENFFASAGQVSFLQSWEWGDFQQSVGNRVLRLQLMEEGKIIGQFQGFVHHLPLGQKFVYAPRVDWPVDKFKILVDYLKEKKYIFVRVEPGKDEKKTLRGVNKTSNRQPANSLRLHVATQSVDQILQKMHSKTRYNIRLAERKAVIVKNKKDIDIFWKLNEQTSQRDKFKSHNREYYQKMLELKSVFQLTAYYNHEPIASNLLVKNGGVLTYLHGASSSENRNVMAPYLLQWEGIKLAAELGCKYYDFWGTAPLKKQTESSVGACFNGFCWQANHPWTGITRFKTGFGGEIVNYPNCFEIGLSPIRFVIFKFFKKIIRLFK